MASWSPGFHSFCKHLDKKFNEKLLYVDTFISVLLTKMFDKTWVYSIFE